MNKKQILKKYWFIIAIILLAIIKQLLISNIPITPYPNQLCDDDMMVEMAKSIRAGKWLGNYTSNTLVKGPVFPIILAIINYFGFSYIGTMNLIYTIACIYFIYTIKDVLKSKKALIFLYLILLFNPVSYAWWTLQRVYRNGITLAQVLIIIGSLFAMYRRRDEKAKKMLKADKKYQEEIKLLEKIKSNLENEMPARSLEYNEEEKEILKDMFLLTSKPIIYVANVSEEQLENCDKDKQVLKVKEYAKKENSEVIPLSIKIEEELSSLDELDKKEMLEALGLKESGLDKLIKKSYDLLGLMSFLTAGEPEVRAWTIKKGTKAPQAAGKIHSDIERGFIKAEVVSYNDLIECGSMVQAKERGLVRQEGKDYIMQDGDIVLFKFNV